MRAVCLIACLLGSGCTPIDAFECIGDSDCSSPDAVCQPAGYCSLPDPACDSGFRYDPSAVDDLAGRCVGPSGPGTITNPTIRQVASVTHSGSSEFTIQFDGTIEAAVVVAIDTEREVNWQIASSDVGDPDTTWVVQLSGHALPVDHTVVIEQRDPDGMLLDTQMVVVPGAEIGNRVMFVSTASGTGDLLTWAALPGTSTASTGLEAADEICQLEASAAGLAGTYRALLTTEVADLQCRIAGLTGEHDQGQNCGLAAPPTGYGPWLTTSGVPVLDSLQAMREKRWFTPLDRRADGTPAAGFIFTGAATLGDHGAAGNDCGDWGSTAGQGYGLLDTADVIPFRTFQTGAPCDAPRQLYCAQTDVGAHALSAVHRQDDGFPAFATSTQFTGNITFPATAAGMASADAHCEALAASANLDPDDVYEFVAYLSVTGLDAPCRLLGIDSAATVAGGCGSGVLPSRGPYRRPDGFRIADDISDIVSSSLLQPLSVDENGAPPAASLVWTGTNIDGSAAIQCGDWDTTAGSGTIGNNPNRDNAFNNAGSLTCDVENKHLYCFAR